MTHDSDTPVPTEPTPQDVSLAVLTIANPAFRFSFMSAGFYRAKWLGSRRKPADPGDRAVADPAALPPDSADIAPESETADTEG